MSRRFLVPEVVQTSAMDCGPAVLTCLLEGFGIPVHYGRLREACQTDVDGTSIDVLEGVANRLGLAAEQVMLPVDYLLLPRLATLPALLVVRQPLGQTHFVLAWRRYGPLVQVMDPAVGRRWVRATGLLTDVYVHTQVVPASAFETWARSAELQGALAHRLRQLGLGRQARRLLAEASALPGWRPLAALDAAIRLADLLVRSGGLRRGRPAHALLVLLWRKACAGADVVPERLWFARPAPPDPSGEERVIIRGAVLVRALGQRPPGEEGPPLPPELAAALAEPRSRPWRTVRSLLGAGAGRALAGLALGLLLAAGLMLLEALLLRGLIDLGRDLALVEQRLAALGLVLGLGLVLLLLELRLSAGLAWLGRQVEVRLRLAFAAKLPRLHDRYFQSRPISDMAERCHSVQQLRPMPRLLGQVVQTAGLLVLMAGGIALFDPPSGPLAVLACGLALALPLLFRPWLAELDLRLRTHTGALGRFSFDALQGLSAIRAHAAERTVEREQEGLLVEWARTARRYLAVVLLLEGLQVATGFALAGWLLLRHVHVLADTGAALLLAYWTLSLPELGGALAGLVRQYPLQRNILLRLLEPLGALAAPLGEGTTCGGPAVSLSFEGVTVRAAGQTILEDIRLHVPAGRHVAVLGPSGAGKSSLVGLLLGWHRAAEGRVLIDGEPLDPLRLDRLRQETAWVDPAVYLWKRSLIDNLRYGNADVDAGRLGEVGGQAELVRVLEKLPDGMQTPLGEGGGLLSGGQGQQVRLGRALLRRPARLVLLDEPFRGLDRAERRALARRAREQWRDTTLLFITHDVGDTREFDRVVVLAQGKVVEDGVPAELAARPGSQYARLLEAEEEVRTRLWQGAPWRRLWMEDGRLTEGPS
jgi:ATP-binding cassette subfamily B protein